MSALNILVVEDERIVAEDLRDRLEMLDYCVMGIASSGEEAIEFVSRTRPDVILMDIRLHGELDGTKTAQRIQSVCDVPIVYLTAYADEHTFLRAMQTEPFGYLLKPVESRELHTSIEMAYYKHRMERKLKESQEWLATTLRSIGDAVIATDAQGRVKFMNSMAETLTGWKQEEALGRELPEVFASKTIVPEEHQLANSDAPGLGAGPHPTVVMARDGSQIPVDDNIAPIRDLRGNVTGIVVVFKDVSDRLRAEETLRNVSKRILDAQEAERRRVARELHDSVIQILSSVKFRFLALQEHYTKHNGQSQHEVDRVRDLLDRAMHEVRRISRGLLPSELDDLGLSAAVSAACEEFQERTGIAVIFECDEIPENLDSEVMLTLYRIVQESFSNVEKHAQAKNVSVRFERLDAHIKLTVRDDGRGFNIRTQRTRRAKDSGLGLIGMLERIQFTGGTLTVNSAPRKGTEIIALLPIKEHQSKGVTDEHADR